MHSRCHRSCTFRLLGGSCGGTKLFKRGAKSIFVRVRISCDHSNALPTKFLHCFQIYTSSNQSCCPAVTQAMPCEVLFRGISPCFCEPPRFGMTKDFAHPDASTVEHSQCG